MGLDRTQSSRAVIPGKNLSYRLVVMGAAKVGKTSIITRFLHDHFVSDYKATVEDLYHGEYLIDGLSLIIEILDTTGSFAFPAMRQLAISKGDAFILVYSVEDEKSFEAVRILREQIIHEKGGNENTPIIVVANKVDKDSQWNALRKHIAETTVSVDWGHCYLEASAKDCTNISGIFKELLDKTVESSLSPAAKQNNVKTLPNKSMAKKSIYKSIRQAISIKSRKHRIVTY